MHFTNTFLMAEPYGYCVDYKINPWMKPKTENRLKAIKQWKILQHTLIRLGCFIESSVAGVLDNIPDFVFSANAGIALNGNFVAARFRHPERQKEEKY